METKGDDTAADSASTPQADEKPAADTKAGKKRSEWPYPYYDLEESLEVARAVGKHGGSGVRDVALAKEINREATSRFFNYYLSSAKEFGLVTRDRVEDGMRTSLTDLGRRLIVKIDEATTRADRMRAFLTPKLYRALAQRYKGIELPDVEGLANLLELDYGLVGGVKVPAAEGFRKSAAFAGFLTADGRIEFSEEGAPSSDAAKQSATPPSVAPSTSPPNPTVEKPGMQSIHVPDTFVVYRCKISQGRVIEVPLPRDFKMADVNRLCAFLKTQVDDDLPAEVKGE
jgi:hypothetical protein